MSFMDAPVKIGISACLFGEPVRYDGGHRRDPFLVEILGRYVTFVPVCPEVECGLGVPREAMRLTGDPAAPRLVTIHTGQDLTDRMKKWADRRVAELEKENLCGFIFKSRSPSSGMERVKVYQGGGAPVKTGVGLFAKAFIARFPLLPVEDDGRLRDPGLRKNFITRIFVLKRWRGLLANNKTRAGLVAFHASHALLLLSHSEKHYRTMGKLIARAKDLPPAELFGQYETLILEALRLKSTLAKNSSVLLHILGNLKKMLSRDEKQEMMEIIDRYRHGVVPLIVPITLINHYVRKHEDAYLAGQVYLNPDPPAGC